jgi:hypothetical protein
MKSDLEGKAKDERRVCEYTHSVTKNSGASAVPLLLLQFLIIACCFFFDDLKQNTKQFEYF